MNKNIKKNLAVAAIALLTGCVHAGTWVNGCYIDGPLCTVCDGMRVVQHAYGTTVCAHCDGTGVEPPEVIPVVNTVVVDDWCPPPQRYHYHHPHARHAAHPPRHVGRPAGRPAPRTPARAAAPRGGRTRTAAPRGGGHGAPRGGRGGRRR